ncbi:MAG TPA: type IV secretion system DNA-binding domain-containing protein [Pirellulales bacterium]|nr:type IV secretion system DNA-binding domain-containing protein [Pirellulales bacterium]
MRKKNPKKSRTFHKRQVLDLFNESAAGIAISGDSGTGKSNTMNVLMDALARQEVGLTLVDPHGDLAQDFEYCCSALPRRLRERCQVIRPCDLSRMVSLNPLHVSPAGGDWLRWRARIASKVSQVARILLYAWGERDFNSKPVLFKWLTRVLTTMATAGMTIPDARHFFQVGGDVYQALANAAPDVLARVEMNELIEMRPREREDLIASTKNRLLGFLENPLVELALGRPHGWIDAGTMIRERKFTIISLERGGVLREEDQEIFANLWLSELLNAAYDLPRQERTPHVVFLDELPVFGSSFDVLTRALAQVRKFKIRLVAAFQGTQLFPEREEDRLLNALISQCRTTVVFRHKNPVDAKFFGELVTLPVLDPLAEKHRLTQTQQYQDGNEVVFLTDESDSWSDARQDGGSQSDAQSDTKTDTTTDSRTSGTGDTVTKNERALSEAVSRARTNQTGNSISRATSRANSRTDGTSWSNTNTRGASRTRKMTLVPRLRWREIVSSIQFFSPDEQVAFGARDVTRQVTGEAVVYTAGEAPMRVRFPLARGPFDGTPKFAAKQLQALRVEITSRPMFATPAEIVAERREFERRLITHLEQLAIESQPIVIPPPARETPNNPLLSI